MEKVESAGELGMDDGGSGNLPICPMLMVLSAMADALVSTDAADLCRELQVAERDVSFVVDITLA